MYRFFRPLLFRLAPEQAHSLTLSLLRLAGALPPARAFLRLCFAVPRDPLQAFGLAFSNRVGLAAGYDKDGLGWRGLACLGFGHIEIGTVTPQAQPGNPRPRVFRLPQESALINRMGFPGRGADFVATRLQGKRPPGLVLGVNLGKNKDTPLEEAAQDYLLLVEKFAPLADYLAINVSSPNTTGLRRLQARHALDDLLAQLEQKRRAQEAGLKKRLPLLVKLAPDLTDQELDDALEVIQGNRMDGVIATNTTLSRDNLHSPVAGESGGLSGAPLSERSTYLVRQIYQRTRGKLPVIGVGGVMSYEDARAKLEAGAVLVQVYTGLVYAGPGLVKHILLGLR
jgi:dihydroorotate dehydrogenase